MRETTILLWVTIGVAIVFDFTNGFHDTANAIATSISTRAMSPRAAVGLAAAFNLIGAVVTVAFFQAKVSNTIWETGVLSPSSEALPGGPGLVDAESGRGRRG